MPGGEQLHVEQLHTHAYLTMLKASPPGNPALIVYDGEVPDDAVPPYVLLYTHTTRPDGTSLTHKSDHAVTRGICHCVAEDAAGARALAGRTAAGLVDKKPVIEGRTCWPIYDANESLPPRPDESTGTRLIDQIVVYLMESLPAPAV